jgi:aminoglycoside phosphotransferase (APT) family kinase protein
LFLEDVGDRRLDRRGVASWEAAVRWLARLHGEYAAGGSRLAGVNLAVHDRSFYWSLADDAGRSVGRRATPAARARFDLLIGSFDATVDALTARPRTLVHGSMTAQNVHIQRDTDRRLVVRPLDWEAAATGLPAWDLAKLLSGWGATGKRRLLETYRDERRRSGTRSSASDLHVELSHTEILRTLRALHWWRDECHSPAFVEGLLDRMAATWRRLGVQAVRG